MEKRAWESGYVEEITKARQAREAGNEGMARVCARRAAGVLIQEYIAQQGIQTRQTNILDLIQTVSDFDGVPSQARDLLEHFSRRVEPGGELSPEIDLIEDTLKLMAVFGLD
jgi:hypothetical protein